MATMSAIQIAEIAAKLFKTWKDSGTSSESNPLTLEMVLNVVKLAAGDPSSKVAAAVTVVEALPKVIDFVAKLQSRLNSHRRDGVLDVRTWERVKQVLRGCEEKDEPGEPLAEGCDAKMMADAGLPAILFYFIDEPSFTRVLGGDAPPKIEGERVSSLIADAWHLWQLHSNLFLREVDSCTEANVVIEMGSLDGSGPMLGLAHVGGKSITTRLKLRLDEKEKWTAEKFRAATCHELGHILGLKHSHRADQLMSPFLNLEDRIVEPKDEDIERIQKIWGKPGKPTDSTSGSPAPSSY